jgi:hypothetical protein
VVARISQNESAKPENFLRGLSFMKRLGLTVAILGALAAAFGGVAFFRHSFSASASRAAERSAPAASSSPTSGGARVPVIVELFTSEGCSSCPPADAVLARLAAEQPVPEAEIIPLGEHVDYWNSIGWPDPFSSSEISRRQRAYAQAFGDSQVYTPQAVIDGVRECIGSNRAEVTARIRQAAQSPKAHVEIRPKSGSGGSLALDIAVSQLPADAGRECDVMLALVENDLTTDVRRGENAGRRLEHAAVVRSLASVGRVERGATRTFTTTAEVSPEWKRKNMRIVAFVQNRDTRRIFGAASAAL